MKITLVYPALGKKDDGKYITTQHLEPLPIALLAGITPKDIEIEFFDDRFEDINYGTRTDLVAISVETHTAFRAYQIAARFRKQGVPVVLGGFHPSLLPDEAGQYADSVVIGEAESHWENVIEDAKHGRLKKVYRSDKRPSMELSKYDRGVFKDKKYLPVAMIETGRGCLFSCNFCCVSKVFNKTHNNRPLGNVLDEISGQKAKYIVFVDDNLVADVSYAKQLFRSIIPMKKTWAAQVPITVAYDDELLDLMVKSGCICMLIGFESINKENISSMKKNLNIKVDYDHALKKLRDRGILVDASFVLGYDSDTEETLDRTLEFVIRNKVAFAYFNHLRPYPGTDKYDQLRGEGRMTNEKWWLDPDHHFGDISFIPKNMKPEELVRKCDDMKKRFFSNSCIFYRGLDFKANMKGLTRAILYVFLNMLNRKEIKQKKNLKFGSRRVNEPIPV